MGGDRGSFSDLSGLTVGPRGGATVGATHGASRRVKNDSKQVKVIGNIRFLHKVFIGIIEVFIRISMPRHGATIGHMFKLIQLKG